MLRAIVTCHLKKRAQHVVVSDGAVLARAEGSAPIYLVKNAFPAPARRTTSAAEISDERLANTHAAKRQTPYHNLGVTARHRHSAKFFSTRDPPSTVSLRSS